MLAVIDYEDMIWIATMELKWITQEIVIDRIDANGVGVSVTTGRHEKILHQKFINNEGDAEWREVPTD